MHFLQPIATSKYTLPAVGIVCALIWAFGNNVSDRTPLLLGMAASAAAVYLITELNSRHALLRNGSRMIGCAAIIMLTALVQLHPLSPSHALLLLHVVSLHLLFSSVRLQSPSHTFFVYLPLSLMSFILPVVFLLLPVYWIAQAYMRAMSLRCFLASIIGILTPYWLSFGYYVYLEEYGQIQVLADRLIDICAPDYSAVTPLHILQLVYIALFLFVGIVDFYQNSYKEKSLIRTIYTSVFIHAVFFLILIALQPQSFYLIQPFLIIDTAIMAGHFFALTYTRFSHIVSILFLVLSLLVFIVSLIPEPLLPWNP